MFRLRTSAPATASSARLPVSFGVTTTTTSLGTASVPILVVTQRRWSHARPTHAEISAALKSLDARIDLSPKDLKKKYMELVKKHHPDKPGGCPEKMKTITTSYDCLKSLSSSERSAYQGQFGGGAGAGRTDARPSGMYANASARNHNAGARQGARAAYDWQRMYEEQQRSRDFAYAYSKGKHGGNAAFDQKNAFRSFTGPWRTSMLKMPLSRIMFRVALIYVGITTIFLVVYRRYRDWLHDDGWRSTESINRKEQMDDMYRMRTELLDKLGKSPYMSKLIAERERERQMMEFSAAQSRINQELQRSGFEPFHPMLGSLHRELDDPEGVVYFEPKNEVHGPQSGGPMVLPAHVPPHLAAGRENAIAPPRVGATSPPTGVQVTHLPERSSYYTNQPAKDPTAQSAVAYLRARDGGANNASKPYDAIDEHRARMKVAGNVPPTAQSWPGNMTPQAASGSY